MERTEVRVSVEDRTLTLVNLAKVMYPRTGTTKADVFDYYARVAPLLLPGLADRPVSRIRWPHGVEGESFHEKNAPGGTPSWVRQVEVGSVTYPVVDSVATLIWLANLAALELHVPQWRLGSDDRPLPPDRLVIDLDPGPPAGLQECCQVAVLARERLVDLGLEPRVVSSGSAGLHLYADLDGTRSSEAASDLARTLAAGLERDFGQLVVSNMAKAARSGKVFLDWSQNNQAKTTIAPYSLRGRVRPQVAAPRTWDEVVEGVSDPLGLEQLSYLEVLEREGL